MSDHSTSAIFDRASQLGGPVPFCPDDLLKLPTYREEVLSKRHPIMNGEVVLRFPCVGDEVEISRLTARLGGTLEARIMAAFLVCVDVAPRSWYGPPPAGELTPTLAIGRLPDFPALVALYTRWIAWRDSFRDGCPEAPAGSAADVSGAPPVAGGQGAPGQPVQP